MSLPLHDAEPVLADVRVLRRVGDEPLFGQPRGEAVIISRVAVGIGDVAGPPFETVLANHHRPPLAWLDVFGDQKNSRGENAWPHIQRDFVSAELWMIVDQPRARVGRRVRFRHAADYLAPDVVPVELRAGLPILRRGRVGLSPELLPASRRLPDQLLRVPEI